MTVWSVLELICFASRISKGIAVNDDLLYDISRCMNHISDGGAVIFANSRLVATSDILKPVHRYGQIKGVHIFTYRFIQHIDPLYQAQISSEFSTDHYSLLCLLLPSR